MRLKDIAYINRDVLPETTDPEYSFKYIDISSVDNLGAIAIPDQLTLFAQAPSRARRRATAGSTVVSTVRTYLRAIAQVKPSDENLIFSTGFAVLEAKPTVEDRFLAYVCRSQPFINEVVARSVGVSYPAINPGDLASIAVPVPPLDEQQRIADFLDTETARLDQLARAIAEGSVLLQARRTAILMSAFPKGRHGVRLGYFLDLVTSGPRGWGDYVGDEGTPFFRSANLRRDSIYPNLEDLALAQPPLSAAAEAARSRVRVGDVLVGITGANTGWVSWADRQIERANVSQHVCLVRPGKRVEGRWLAYALSAPQVQELLLGSQYGGTKTQLSLGDIRDLVVPLPHIEEQQRIVADIGEGLSAITTQHTLRQKQLAVLGERRQALITAAVTGGITV
jgi:type I restriction enzyme S subunit